MKHILLFLALGTSIALRVYGQQACEHSTQLYCQIPVATRAVFPGTQGNPAAAFNSGFATQLALLPLVSSASGSVPVLDRSLGIYVSSDNLGPIFTERARTIGKRKLFVAFTYQRFRFNSIDGTNLGAVPFVFRASPGNNPSSSIYVQQTDQIQMKLDQYVALATYGVNDKMDISVIVPFERVSVGVLSNGTQFVASEEGKATVPFSQYVPGSARGIGDLLVNAKRLLWKGERTDLAAGMIVRFPTGDALNYLGSGAYGFDPYAVLSYQARVSPHVRLGYQFNTTTVLDRSPITNEPLGLPGGLQYDVGADANIFKKILTAAADLLGNYVVNAPILAPGTVVIPEFNLTEPTLNPKTSSYTLDQLSLGVKVRPTKHLFFYGNVLIQLNNIGLRSNPVPLIGISYKFDL